MTNHFSPAGFLKRSVELFVKSRSLIERAETLLFRRCCNRPQAGQSPHSVRKFRANAIDSTIGKPWRQQLITAVGTLAAPCSVAKFDQKGNGAADVRLQLAK